MGIELDPSPELAQYAHPHKLVTSAWLGGKLGLPDLKVIESDEESLPYDIGHIPTAMRICWDKDLNDSPHRDFIDGAAFARLMQSKGISRTDTVVIYGDRSNLWAMYTLWVFELFGHPDVRLLDGGRDAWMQEEKEISYAVPEFPATDYPEVTRDDSTHRIFADELQSRLEEFQILDLRDQMDFSGSSSEDTTAHNSVNVSRTGHIPGAANLSSSANLHPNSRFRARAELDQQLHSALAEQDRQLQPAGPTVVYCTDGARAAGQWFTLHHLLGWENVRLYDGSWVEWGNRVRAPIAHGDASASA